MFWANRVYVDLLFASPVKFCASEFNRPALGDLPGAGGRRAGREADLYAACRYHHFVFGAAYGQWISGNF